MWHCISDDVLCGCRPEGCLPLCLIILQERSQQATAEIERLQRQLREASLAQVCTTLLHQTALPGFCCVSRACSMSARCLLSCVPQLRAGTVPNGLAADATQLIHTGLASHPRLVMLVLFVSTQEVLAQRNATLERLLSLRAATAAQYAVADAAADAAPTEQASVKPCTVDVKCARHVCTSGFLQRTHVVLLCLVPLLEKDVGSSSSTAAAQVRSMSVVRSGNTQLSAVLLS
jgi:hypothetical protein